jgi:hypothetical protein
MSNRTFPLLLAACVVTSSVWAATDPFVGKWKVNSSKSTLTDEMKVEAVGPNKYAKFRSERRKPSSARSQD